jgi:hypothetical protein
MSDSSAHECAAIDQSGTVDVERRLTFCPDGSPRTRGLCPVKRFSSVSELFGDAAASVIATQVALRGDPTRRPRECAAEAVLLFVQARGSDHHSRRRTGRRTCNPIRTRAAPPHARVRFRSGRCCRATIGSRAAVHARAPGSAHRIGKPGISPGSPLRPDRHKRCHCTTDATPRGRCDARREQDSDRCRPGRLVC